MDIKKIELDSYKRVELADILLGRVTILVGENNSGKSSVLQGIHYHLVAALARSESGTETFVNGQIMYQPAHDFLHLRNAGPYGNNRGVDNSSKLTVQGAHLDGSLFEYTIELRKGRNADNITCTTGGDQRVGQAVANRALPFSILVPGLAGIPIREEFRSRSIVLKSIPSGDANLYLRNILLLISTEGKLAQINSMLQEVFPTFSVGVQFEPKSDSYIECFVSDGSHNTPLELVGTGVLQTIQIFSYVVLFQPKLLLLDEPDSHLHPDNQKRLSGALNRVSTEFDTKILISTHSKHIIDSFLGFAEFVRMKEGRKIEQGSDVNRLSMLIDIGALDSYDKLKNGLVDRVVLTEDASKDMLKVLLAANGFNLERTLIVSYKTCSNISAAIVLIEFMKEVAESSAVIVHRDRDFMTDSEVTVYETSIRANGGVPFVTQHSDIEGYFCRPEHVGERLELLVSDAVAWLDELATSNHIPLQHEFTRKRDEVKALLRNKVTSFPPTEELLGNQVPLSPEKRKGKSMIKLINGQMHSRFGKTVNLVSISNFLEDRNLTFSST